MRSGIRTNASGAHGIDSRAPIGAHVTLPVPCQVTDLDSVIVPGSLKFTSPFADCVGSVGNCVNLEVRFADTQILTESDWNAATFASNQGDLTMGSLNAGAACVLADAETGNGYWFAIKYQNSSGVWGPVSNSVYS